MKTNQELFNEMVAGFAAQNWEHAVEDHPDGTRCRYRAPGGRKCAVGQIISDAVYNPRMEGAGMANVISGYWIAYGESHAKDSPISALHEALQKSDVSRESYQFLRACQLAHDDSKDDPEYLKCNLRRVGNSYGLTLPEALA